MMMMNWVNKIMPTVLVTGQGLYRTRRFLP